MATRKAEYLSKETKKLQKAVIAQEIVDVIHKNGGRFLSQLQKPPQPKKQQQQPQQLLLLSQDPHGNHDNHTNDDTDDNDDGVVWVEVSLERAKKKCGQALREDAPEFREELELLHNDEVPTSNNHNNNNIQQQWRQQHFHQTNEESEMVLFPNERQSQRPQQIIQEENDHDEESFRDPFDEDLNKVFGVIPSSLDTGNRSSSTPPPPPNPLPRFTSSISMMDADSDIDMATAADSLSLLDDYGFQSMNQVVPPLHPNHNGKRRPLLTREVSNGGGSFNRMRSFTDTSKEMFMAIHSFQNYDTTPPPTTTPTNSNQGPFPSSPQRLRSFTADGNCRNSWIQSVPLFAGGSSSRQRTFTNTSAMSDLEDTTTTSISNYRMPMMMTSSRDDGNIGVRTRTRTSSGSYIRSGSIGNNSYSYCLDENDNDAKSWMSNSRMSLMSATMEALDLASGSFFSMEKERSP